jgi:hypothetical protein
MSYLIMKKVNIQKNWICWRKKELIRNWLGVNSGQNTKKTELSEYVKDCYIKVVKCHESTSEIQLLLRREKLGFFIY